MSRFTHIFQSPMLGLDIQSSEIRLLQLKNKQLIKQAMATSLPADIVIEGKIQEPELLSQYLAEVVQRHQLQGLSVAIALPVHCVITKRISLTRGLREPEWESEVESHLTHCLPNAKEGLCYDYAILGTQDDMQEEALIVATHFNNLNTYVTAVQNAGLKVCVVDVDSYACARAVDFIAKNSLEVEEKWLVSYGLALRSSLLW